MSACSHVTRGQNPFETVLVLDDQLGPTEFLGRCRRCGKLYLLEMFDWHDSLRAFRLSVPAPGSTEALLRDLERGSCDLSRAREEVRAFTLTSTRLEALILMDTSRQTLIETASSRDFELAVPTETWRELPCDGSWIKRLQGRRL
jgi:hypothetical protein